MDKNLTSASSIANSIDHNNLSSYTLLLLHQNRVVRRRYSRILSDKLNLLEFDNVDKALKSIDLETPNIILLDVNLTDLNERSLIQYLKSHDKYKDIPIIISVSENEPLLRLTALKQGADFYILESCIDDEVIEIVRRILKEAILNDTAKQQETSLLALVKEKSNLLKQLANSEIYIEKKDHDLAIINSQNEMLRVQEKNLHRISNTIRNSFDINSNLRQAVDDLSGWYNLDCCFITLPSEDTEADTIRCESTTNDEYKVVETGHDLKTLEFFKQYSQAFEPIIISDVNNDIKFSLIKNHVLGNISATSLFYFPISYEQKLLGILGGIKVESLGRWSDDNKNFLANVSNQIAIGVVNARLYAAVQRQATSDGLTGLLNHRTGQEKLSEQIRMAERYQRNLSVMMIDVDFFKSINDKYGHPAGDTVLKAVARLVKNNCRDVDIAVRYGGEEFMLILPEIAQDAAIVVAERIRKNLSMEIIHHENLEIQVTASLGISSYPEDAKTQTQLLSLADKALYLSKRLGRNQVHSSADLLYEEITSKEQLAKTAKPSPVMQYINQVELPEISQAAKEQEELIPEVVEMVKALASSLYSRSEYNKSHHLETAKLSELLAKVMGLPQREIEQIRVAGLLHDVGTLALPSDLLNKDGHMSEAEKLAIKEHVVIGVQMLKPIRALKNICEILENHHERFDGTGYPKGLKGEEIPLPARIVTVVDSFHAMISDRPYRKALSVEDAIINLKQEAGKQFDPLIVDIFITVLNDLYKNSP